MQQHWDRTYAEKSLEELGWYEPDPEPSLALIDRCELSEDARIIDVGAGATLLVDQLLDRGYQSLGVLDISAQALKVLREQLDPQRAARVRWINADITDRLLAGALACLEQHGGARDDVEVVHVPGAWELPPTAARIIGLNRHDAIIALGCVIRGDTPHFDYVCTEASAGLGAVARSASASR